MAACPAPRLRIPCPLPVFRLLRHQGFWDAYSEVFSGVSFLLLLAPRLLSRRLLSPPSAALAASASASSRVIMVYVFGAWNPDMMSPSAARFAPLALNPCIDSSLHSSNPREGRRIASCCTCPADARG